MPAPTPAASAEASTDFRSRWLTRFGLPSRGWLAQLRGEARKRRFADATELVALVRFLFDVVPALVDRASGDRFLVAETYGLLCFQAWQSGSHFPAFAENYAQIFKSAMEADHITATHSIIAELLQNQAGSEDTCGFQRLQLAHPDLVRSAEGWLQDGDFGPFLKAKAKYREFEQELRNPHGFARDWAMVRRAFPRETASKQILRRSLLPERNWVRDGGAHFATAADRFQAVLDLLCWKYCLWGVARGRPLLLKPSVVFTPLGTQIFVPAYLSFDAKRDLDLGLITKLHRARGIRRQGEGFSVSRTELQRRCRLAQAANHMARKNGLRGDKRYAFITQHLGLLDNGDYREIRKLLARQA